MNSNNNNQQVDEKRLNERARCRRYYHEHKEHIAETQRRYYKRNALKFAILGRQKRERKSLALNGTIPAKRTSKYDIHSKIAADQSVANTLHNGMQNQPSVQTVTYVTNGFDNCVQPGVQPFTNVVNYVQPAINLVNGFNNYVQQGVQTVMYVTNGFDNYVQPAINLVNGFNNYVQPGVQTVTYVTNGFDNYVQPGVQPTMNVVNCVQPSVQPTMNVVNCVQPSIQQSNDETNML